MGRIYEKSYLDAAQCARICLYSMNEPSSKSLFPWHQSACPRRVFAGYLAKTLLGVGVGMTGRLSIPDALGATVPPKGSRGRASKVIYLYMNGGMSHLDT